jgi:hypothetical protein
VLFDNVYTRDAAGRITAINGLAATDDWIYGYKLRRDRDRGRQALFAVQR